MSKVCDCKDYCLDSVCVSSDSGLTVRMCWCADCSARCVEIEKSAYKVVGCVQCGDTNDLTARFSRIPVCGKCARKNYRKAVGR
jgi:hypothetical protein